MCFKEWPRWVAPQVPQKIHRPRQIDKPLWFRVLSINDQVGQPPLVPTPVHISPEPVLTFDDQRSYVRF